MCVCVSVCVGVCTRFSLTRCREGEEKKWKTHLLGVCYVRARKHITAWSLQWPPPPWRGGLAAVTRVGHGAWKTPGASPAPTGAEDAGPPPPAVLPPQAALGTQLREQEKGNEGVESVFSMI